MCRYHSPPGHFCVDFYDRTLSLLIIKLDALQRNSWRRPRRCPRRPSRPPWTARWWAAATTRAAGTRRWTCPPRPSRGRPRPPIRAAAGRPAPRTRCCRSGGRARSWGTWRATWRPRTCGISSTIWAPRWLSPKPAGKLHVLVP